ncbi:MAG TPA: ABC transporter, partial [Myxococcaceae bacterium]|nr:ABC transporter [Myxococcaceae bacterium]
MTRRVDTSASTGEAHAPGGLALQWATVRVLLARDVVRFFRQPSRIIGALA